MKTAVEIIAREIGIDHYLDLSVSEELKMLYGKDLAEKIIKALERNGFFIEESRDRKLKRLKKEVK